MQVLNKFHFFNISEILTILLWNINNFKISEEKQNIISNIFQNPVYYRNCISQTYFLAVKLILQ